MEFLETSAKTAYNVTETFVRVSANLMERIEKGQINMEDSPPGIKIGQMKSL